MVTEYLERYLVMFDLGDLQEQVLLCQRHDLTLWQLHLDQGGRRQTFLLTLMNALSFDEAPRRVRLVADLHRARLPVPAPLTTLDGMSMTVFSGKPAMLQRIAGATQPSPTAAQCRAMGRSLAALHCHTGSAAFAATGPRAGTRLGAALDVAAAQLPGNDRDALARVHAAAVQDLAAAGDALPSGLVHGCPVRDHLWFEDERIEGWTAFHRAGHGRLLDDLGSALIDWSLDPEGGIDPARFQGALSGYGEARALHDAERRLLAPALRLAICELWMDALLDGPGSAAAHAPLWRRRLAAADAAAAMAAPADH